MFVCRVGQCEVFEIVFVGQCEVFVCRDLVHFFLFCFPLVCRTV